MPTEKKEPETDLSKILEGLLSSNIKFILVGGLAAVIQGAPVTTMDVDIVHDRSSENISRLFLFLKTLGAVYRRPDDKIIAPKEVDLAGMGHLLLNTSLGPLDILSFIENSSTYEDLEEHTIEIEFRGHVLRVLNLRTLVELKRSTKNSSQKQRLQVLEETLRQLE